MTRTEYFLVGTVKDVEIALETIAHERNTQALEDFKVGDAVQLCDDDCDWVHSRWSDRWLVDKVSTGDPESDGIWLRHQAAGLYWFVPAFELWRLT